MKFDRTKISEQMLARGLGTGTLASAAGIGPDDLQRILVTQEAPKEIGTKLVEFLGKDILTDESTTQLLPVTDHSIGAIKSLIEDGSWIPADVYKAESAQSSPRRTLITWLEEEFSLLP